MDRRLLLFLYLHHLYMRLICLNKSAFTFLSFFRVNFSINLYFQQRF